MKKTYSIKEEGAAVAFLLGLAAFYFFPVLIKENSQVLSRSGSDTWSQFFYWRHFGFGALARGEMPLWNPYIFSGTPYIAGIQSAVFYPLNLLYLIFDTPFAINLNIAIHCFLASLFTYLFARYIDISPTGSILSALTFSYGAPYFIHIYPGHLSDLSTMVWLPLILLGLEAYLRKKEIKYALVAGILLSVQILAGHPQYVFYSLIGASLYFVLSWFGRRKDLKRPVVFFLGFCLFLVSGFLLSAVQILPTLELTKQSVREALTYEWVSAFSFPPENWITLVVPDFFGDMLKVPYWGKNYLWETSVYLGIIPITMVAIALIVGRSLRVWIFFTIAAISLLLALGKYTPVLKFLYSYVPGFNMFRGLSKFVFVFSFASSIIAGCGLEKLAALAEERSPKLRYLSFALLAVSLFFVAMGCLGWLYGWDSWKSVVAGVASGEDRYSPVSALTEEDFFKASMGAAFRSVLQTSLLWLTLGTILLLFAKVKKLPSKFLPVSIIALAAIDLWTFGARYLVTFNPEDLSMDRELKAFFKTDREPFRVATPLFDLLNIGLLEGIENVGGYDAIVVRNYSEFINLSQGVPIEQPNIAMNIRRDSLLLDLLNVKYFVVVPAINIDFPNFDLVFQNRNYKVYRNSRALPRSFIVHDVWIIKERDAIFRTMTSSDFDGNLHAIIGEEVEGASHDSNIHDAVPKIKEHSLNKVLIEADLYAPGLLVLSDACYPGWKAFVDGKETRIYRTNYVMRGVFLPKGRHAVEFKYEPFSFKAGGLLSLTAFVLILGYFAWARVKKTNMVDS